MSFKILTTPEFVKQVKRLSKKHSKLSEDLKSLQKILLENPHSGNHLGGNCYKLRLKNTSSHKGKSGGYRVIFFLIDEHETIRLLSIYSKSEKVSITDDEIKKILRDNNLIPK